MNKILKNLIKNALSSRRKINKNSYFGGGLIKGFSFEEGGVADYDPDWKPRRVYIPGDEEVPEVVESEEEVELFPYLLGNKGMAKHVDENQTYWPGAFDEWKNTERVINYNGKTYITSGNHNLGDGAVNPETNKLEINSDVGIGTYYLAINPDDPNDTIIIKATQLDMNYYQRIVDNGNESLKPDGQGDYIYDETRINHFTPDIINVERATPRGDGKIRGRYKDTHGENQNIIIIDTDYKDVGFKTKWTKLLINLMPNKSDRDEVKEHLLKAGIKYEDLPDK